jgi:predicted RNA polymerase sigma factor
VSSENMHEKTIEAVWHMESAKIIAKLARMLRNVGLAEEIAQDAWVAALEHWAAAGLPENPGAWLMTTAKNRARPRPIGWRS